MKSIVPFISNLSKSEVDQWVKVLKKKLKGTEVVKFSSLKQSDYKKVEVAIVANRNPKEIKKLTNLKWIQSIWVGVELSIGFSVSIFFAISGSSCIFNFDAFTKLESFRNPSNIVMFFSAIPL